MNACACSVAILVVAACGKSDATIEGERVAAAIGRMRDAPREQRGPLIDALGAMTPRGELAKQAADRCLTAYQGLEAAHTELDTVQEAVETAATAKRDADPALLHKLVAAEEKLTQAKADQAGCASAVMALQRSLR